MSVQKSEDKKEDLNVKDTGMLQVPISCGAWEDRLRTTINGLTKKEKRTILDYAYCLYKEHSLEV